MMVPFTSREVSGDSSEPSAHTLMVYVMLRCVCMESCYVHDTMRMCMRCSVCVSHNNTCSA